MPILVTTIMVLIFWTRPTDAYDYDPAAVAQEFTECAGIFQAIAESNEHTDPDAADYYYEASDDAAQTALIIVEDDDERNYGRFTDWAYALVDNHAAHWRSVIRHYGITHDAEHQLEKCDSLSHRP